MTRGKVIIVGGGVAGLSLAVALEHANIDYVLLESREIAPQLGASIIIWGGCMRMLDQLGILQNVEKRATPLNYISKQYEDTTPMLQGDFPRLFAQQFGYEMLALERQQLLQSFYEHLQNKSNCIPNSKVVSYEEKPNGVEVKCEDGTVYEGDVIVGADGVHSITRQLMFEKMKQDGHSPTSPGFYAQLSCVFGISESNDLLPIGNYYFLEGHQRSFLVICAKDKTFFVIFESQPCVYYPDIPRYSMADAEKSMESVKDVIIDKGVSMGDIMKNKVSFVKVPVEEGVSPISHYGRVCLIGDSVHKFTINDGLGAMLAMEGAFKVANQINKLFMAHENVSPALPISTEEVRTAFSNYWNDHKGRVQKEVGMCGFSARMQAGVSCVYRTARYVMSFLPMSAVVVFFWSRHRLSASLNYLPIPQRKGSAKFHDEM